MMTLHDFFHEEFIPFIKGDYINFSSKVVDGYSLFIGKWDKVPRQANILFPQIVKKVTCRHHK